MGHSKMRSAQIEREGITMYKISTMVVVSVLAFSAAGCADMQNRDAGIMRTAPGDPAGSANIGTGSVTTNSTIPPEAKAAGIGIGP
jgi:hypothetical protein